LEKRGVVKMALQYKLLESGEGIQVDESGHPIVFDDEKEDEKAFPLDALHLYSKIPSLQAEAKQYREKRDEFKKQLEAFSGLNPDEIRTKLATYDGLNPEEARKALETVANMGQLDKDRSVEVTKIKEEANKAFESKMREVQKSYEQQLGDRNGVISQKDIAIRRLMVKGAFDQSEFIKNHTVVHPTMVYNTFGNNFKIEEENGDLQVFAVNSKGDRIFSMSKPGDPASPEEAIEALINEWPYKDTILKTSAGGSGAGGNVQPDVTKRQKLAELQSLNPEERLERIRRIGR